MKTPSPLFPTLLALLTVVGGAGPAQAQIKGGRQACQKLAVGDKEACQREASEKCSAQKFPSIKDQALCTEEVAQRHDGCLKEDYRRACLESQRTFEEVCRPVSEVDFKNPEKTAAWAKAIGQYPQARERVLKFWDTWRECASALPECSPRPVWASVCREAGQQAEERIAQLKASAAKEISEYQSLIQRWKSEERWGDALGDVEKIEARLKQLDQLAGVSDALAIQDAWYSEAKAFAARTRAELEQKQRAKLAGARCPKGRSNDRALLKTFQPLWEDYYAGREAEKVVDYTEKVEVLRIDGKRSQRREPGERELIEEIPVVACTRQQHKEGQRCYVVAATMSRVKPDGGRWQDWEIGALEYDSQLLCENLKK
jgi:hypothetical protein